MVRIESLSIKKKKFCIDLKGAFTKVALILEENLESSNFGIWHLGHYRCVKMNKILFSQNLILMEHKLYMVNQVSNTHSDNILV